MVAPQMLAQGTKMRTEIVVRGIFRARHGVVREARPGETGKVDAPGFRDRFAEIFGPSPAAGPENRPGAEDQRPG